MKTPIAAFLLLMILVVAPHSRAQDPGLMGLFFDEAGSVNCLDVEVVFDYEIFEMYLVLLHPEIDHIYGFFGGMEYSGPFLTLGAFLDPHFLDPDLHLHQFQSVSFEPFPVSEVNILVTYTLMYIPSDWGTDCCFTLTGSWQFPEHESPALLMTPYPEINLQQIPVIQSSFDCTAQIVPGGCEVSNLSRSWDGVKALYR